MYRKTWLEVNLDIIMDNIEIVRKHNPDKELIAVVKANGYGCGAKEIAMAAEKSGIRFAAVSSLEEAVSLRHQGWKYEILILGYIDPEDGQVCVEYDIMTTVVSQEWAQALVANNAKNVRVHLKVDTGMNRIGIKDKEELKETLDLLVSNGAKVEGIFTHYACSDVMDKGMTEEQFEKFKEVVTYLDYPFRWVHADNSDASMWFEDDLTNACRLGIVMYGESGVSDEVKPAISLYTTLAHIKEVNAGESIGYGASYETRRKEIIGTLPIGYADGWFRKNQGRKVYIGGTYGTLVGRVCMDQCMVRLNKKYPIGTRVELFGKHLPLADMAKELDTITYEILCGMSDRLTKVYIYQGEMIEEQNARLVGE
ncbi:MAG: alanine racemase [Erysipelotrichaceae bacterium]|nr:alanine racemase [Erysipelotrichaceae bacterium]